MTNCSLLARFVLANVALKSYHKDNLSSFSLSPGGGGYVKGNHRPQNVSPCKNLRPRVLSLSSHLVAVASFCGCW
jgi:hypothetical protein